MTDTATKTEDLYCNVGHGALAPTAVISITPDALWAAQSHLVKNWGDYGYRVTGFCQLSSRIWVVCYVCTIDGARFGALVDRYGTVRDIPSDASEAWVIATAKEMLAELSEY
jgi:hypothetical protein